MDRTLKHDQISKDDVNFVSLCGTGKKANNKAELGLVGILVNNAGIVKDQNFVLMKEQEWSQVVDKSLN